MLFLAGLMGMIGVGAASFVAVPTDAEDDSELDDKMIDHAEDDSDRFTGTGDEIRMDNGATDPVDGTLHAGLLDDVVFSSEENGDMLGSGDALARSVLDETADGGDPSGDDTAFDFSDYEGPEFSNFMTGDWINQATAPEVIDYEAESESILVVWDDTNLDAREPSLSVSPDPDDPEVMQVNMNGKVVADVYGDSNLSVADLTLMPLSSALIVGLSPA